MDPGLDLDVAARLMDDAVDPERDSRRVRDWWDVVVSCAAALVILGIMALCVWILWATSGG